MNPTTEAAQILTRLFEALARQNGRTLGDSARADIARACDLLSHSGEAFEELFDELPPATDRRPASEYPNGTLFAGGSFTPIDGTAGGRWIARYNTITNTWGPPIGGTVNAVPNEGAREKAQKRDR